MHRSKYLFVVKARECNHPIGKVAFIRVLSLIMKTDFSVNNCQKHLHAIIELIWPHGDKLNSYDFANTEVLRIIEASNLTLFERDQMHRASGDKQIYDPLFPSYNANHVPNTNYIAAEGPNDVGINGLPVHGCIARFFENTLFNQAFPIKLIFAIGRFGNGDIRGDFTHYFKEGTQFYSTFDASSYYIVKSQRLSQVRNEVIVASSALGLVLPLHVTTQSEEVLHLYELLVENPSGSLQTAHLFWLPVDDLQPLLPYPQVILTLAQVYNFSRLEPAIIHCAAGVGRTGTAILVFEILDHFLSIFSQPNPVYMANQICKLLQSIRNIRPAFITTKKQFESAIQCAIDIYSFRTKN